MSKRSKFHTQDLNLSAVLIASGFELAEVSKNNEGRATFCFQVDGRVNQIIEGYWNGRLSLNPQQVFQALKLLKNRIYSNY